MSETKSPAEIEAERIAAWKAERARIAEADKEIRLSRKEQEREASVVQAEEKRDTAALAMVQKAAPTIQPHPNPDLQNGTRNTKRFGMLGRFLIIVVAPMVLMTYYLFAVATPLFEAQSVIAISNSESSASNSGAGLLGGLQRPSTLSEMFRAHSFIRSQAMMDTLEERTGFVSELSSTDIDALRRLRDIEALSYSKLMQFDRFVETSVDIQSGLMTLYVRAPSKEQAREISDIILDVTEIQVNTLSQQLFDQRQTHVFTALDDAHNQLTQAQAALVELQIKYQEVDPRNRIESIYVVIRDLEAQAQELSTFIQRAEIAGVSNSSQTLQSIELERSLRELIEVERTRLVTPIGSSETSLNSLLIEFELANLNVGLAQDAVKTALTAQSRSAQEAALSRSIFQIVVPPGTAQTALYPKIPGILALTLIISLTTLATISLFWRPKWRAATSGLL